MSGTDTRLRDLLLNGEGGGGEGRGSGSGRGYLCCDFQGVLVFYLFKTRERGRRADITWLKVNKPKTEEKKKQQQNNKN